MIVASVVAGIMWKSSWVAVQLFLLGSSEAVFVG
jgi:uncharacterized membrane protein (UPF0182 family)